MLIGIESMDVPLSLMQRMWPQNTKCNILNTIYQIIIIIRNKHYFLFQTRNMNMQRNMCKERTVLIFVSSHAICPLYVTITKSTKSLHRVREVPRTIWSETFERRNFVLEGFQCE